MAKATYGTGTSVLMQTGHMVRGSAGLVTSIAWGIDGKVSYALEGIIHSTGDTINWLKDQLGLIDDVSELEPLATSIPDNQGVADPAMLLKNVDIDQEKAMEKWLEKNHISKSELVKVIDFCQENNYWTTNE